MQPLEELIDRIRWDRMFSQGTFALGYLDRVAGREQVVPFASVEIDSRRPRMLVVPDENGALRQIPLHRVRTVYRDGW